jgi:hypothetical protein
MTATAPPIAVLWYPLVGPPVEYDETLGVAPATEPQKRPETKRKRPAQPRGYERVPVEGEPAA